MTKAMLAAALLLVAAGAHAADGGDYAGALRRMISETAAGRCPADVMGDGLLAACQQQLPAMGPALASLGAITDIAFIKAETKGDARIETYTVTFAGGQKAIWSIGGLKDGRFQAAYTLGQ